MLEVEDWRISEQICLQINIWSNYMIIKEEQIVFLVLEMAAVCATSYGRNSTIARM